MSIGAWRGGEREARANPRETVLTRPRLWG
jgi:hypothetical protein